MLVTDEQATALILDSTRIMDADKFRLSPRMMTLKAIRAKLRPEPMHEPLPPLKVYEPPKAVIRKRRRG